MIISLLRGIQLSMRSKERIANLEERKQQLEDEVRELKTREEYINSPYYLERVAREELQLAKPGETVVILPDTSYLISDKNQKIEEDRERPNYLKWWDVLSGKMN